MPVLGGKEYNANVYPEEPVKKLWSLLKMNDKDYSLSSSKTPHVPLKSGSIRELSKGEDLTLIISKNESGSEIKARGSVISRAASENKRADEKATAKTRKNISDVPKGSSVNISISVDSHFSYGRRSKSNSLRPSSDKKEEKIRNVSSKKSSLSGDSASSTKSVKAKKPIQDSKKATENQPSSEFTGPQHSKLSIKGSSQPTTTAEKVEAVIEENVVASEKTYSFQSSFPPEITPQSRAKSLSKHLSVSSLHKTSFKGSVRKVDVISETEPRSNNSVEGVPAFVLPPEPFRGKVKGSDQNLEVIRETERKQDPPSSKVTASRDLPSIETELVDKESAILSKKSSFPSEQEPARDTSNSPVKISADEIKKLDISKEPDSTKGDVIPSKEDAPSEATVAAADPWSRKGLKPLPHPPSDQVIPRAKHSGEIETHQLRNGTNPIDSSAPEHVQENTQVNSNEDVDKEIKILERSAVMRNGADNRRGSTTDPGKRDPNFDPPSESRDVAPERRRRRSSDEKPVVNSEDWDPDEQPPSIRISEIEMTSNNPEPNRPVEIKTPEPKKSYNSNDSEQLFERHHHPEAASLPTADQDAAIDPTENSKLKVEPAKEKDRINKRENRKKKGRSGKAVEEEGGSTELDGAELGEMIESASADSVQLKADKDYAVTAEELKDDSSNISV